jgi:class 3 adenylate cyclase/CheY-like chemotaxis protein
MPVKKNTKESLPDEFIVWIIEDDVHLNSVIARSLAIAGFTCKSFFSGEEVLDYINNGQYYTKKNSIFLLDLLLDDMNAVELLNLLGERKNNFPFIIMTAYGDEKTAVELMKLGAIDYIIKEKYFVNQIVKIVQQAYEKIQTQKKLEESRIELLNTTRKLKTLNQQINLQKMAIENEKAKTDKLLQTVLPKKIARELLEKGYSKPRHFKNVSILFADVIGFSDLARTNPPIDLVSRLDNFFYVFDEVLEQYGLEKIKTIGDCYMCAGGIPEKHDYNPIITVLTGLMIQKMIRKLNREYKSELPEFRLRLGIHTGEVVAGIVGKIKFAYDIWGDAVNVASRIVDAGEEDKVNISEETYNLVKDYFIFKERGEIITKRNTPIKMFFVERLKPEYSDDDRGIIPNSKLLDIINIKNNSNHL